MSIVKRIIGEADGHYPEFTPKSKGYEERSEIRSVVSQLDNILSRVKDEQIVAELKSVRDKLTAKEKAAVGQRNKLSRDPSTPVVTASQVKSVIQAGTGSNKWKLVKDPEADQDHADAAAQELEDQYDLDVDPKEIQIYTFHNSTNDRSALSYLVIAAVHGQIFVVEWATDRSSGGGSLYPSLDQFQKFLNVNSE